MVEWEKRMEGVLERLQKEAYHETKQQSNANLQ